MLSAEHKKRRLTLVPYRTVEQAKEAQHACVRSYALEQGGIFLL